MLNTSRPLAPEVPELAVLNRREPLLVDEPTPVITETRPPESDDDNPADKITSPPDPLLPEPILT